MVTILLLALMQAPSSPIKTIERGVMSYVENRRELVARTPAEWTMFWRGHSPVHALQLIVEHLYWSLTRGFRKPLVLPERSLRKVVNITKLKGKPNEDKMIPLRLGR